MKKKMNYLILLLTIIFMVGCTNVEDTSNTDVETDSQEVTTVETNKNNEKEETVTTVVDEPVVEETPSVPVRRKHQPNQIMNCSQDTNLLKLMVVICLDIVNLTSSLTLVMGTVNIGHLLMNTGN